MATASTSGGAKARANKHSRKACDRSGKCEKTIATTSSSRHKSPLLSAGKEDKANEEEEKQSGNDPRF
jgi:hypothetical protein